MNKTAVHMNVTIVGEILRCTFEFFLAIIKVILLFSFHHNDYPRSWWWLKLASILRIHSFAEPESDNTGKRKG